MPAPPSAAGTGAAERRPTACSNPLFPMHPWADRLTADLHRGVAQGRHERLGRGFGDPAGQGDSGMGRISGGDRDDMMVALVGDMDARIAEPPYLAQLLEQRLDSIRKAGDRLAVVE